MKDQFTVKELQEYTSAQFKQISLLQEEIKKYQEKIGHLEELLASNTKLISHDSKISDEEFIALNEIRKLRLKSELEDLTYEESKKLELYHKVLNNIRNPKTKEKDPSKDLDDLSTDQLLSELSK